ncbi:MAG: SCO family protein [Alphaproteobacteria bacterium]|nr:SCO family protein [Alphaproteobacteria bacterium]
MRLVSAALALVLALALTAPAATPAAAPDFADLGFQPHPGAGLPLATALQDENGRTVTLGSYFGREPVVLVLEYLHCKTLCGVTLANVIAAFAPLPASSGSGYQLVALSIDPRDGPADAAAAKAKYLADYLPIGRETGIHFLTGQEPSIRAIADAVGFPYRYDPELDQYIHPAGFVVTSPDGRISRYIYGVTPTAAELQSAIDDAAQGRSPGVLTQLLLLCHLAPPRGRYTLAVEAGFVLANIAALLGAIAIFAARWRRRG